MTMGLHSPNGEAPGAASAHPDSTWQRRCTVCGAGELTMLEPCGDYPLARCDRCSHVFVARRIGVDVLDEQYGERYFRSGQQEGHGYADYLARAADRSAAFAARLQWIEKYAGRRGRILDYGCAVGLFVKVAAEHGWDAHGYERSAWAVDYGRKVLGLDIHLGSGQVDPFAPESFDAICLWDVMEHVESPAETVAQVVGWLRPGGVVALNTVNISSLGARIAGRHWRHLLPPHHLQFFTRTSLKRLLDSHGLGIRELRGTGTFLESAKRQHGAARVASAVDDVVGYWRLRPLVSALNLLDEVELVAVKSGPSH